MQITSTKRRLYSKIPILRFRMFFHVLQIIMYVFVDYLHRLQIYMQNIPTLCRLYLRKRRLNLQNGDQIYGNVDLIYKTEIPSTKRGLNPRKRRLNLQNVDYIYGNVDYIYKTQMSFTKRGFNLRNSRLNLQFVDLTYGYVDIIYNMQIKSAIKSSASTKRRFNLPIRTIIVQNVEFCV